MPDRQIYREVARIAVPVGLEMVFQLLLGFIDQVMIGTLGTVAIAAMGLVNSLLFVLGITLGSLASGTGILIARAHGGSQGDAIARISGTAIVLGVLLSLPIVLLFFPVAGPFLRWVGAAQAVVTVGLPFFQIALLTLPIAIAGTVASTTLRSLGQARIPFVATVIAVALNTVLVYMLVFGIGPFPKLGLVGAAWATLAAQGVRAVLVLNSLYGRRGLTHWELPATPAAWRGTSAGLLHLSLSLGVKDISWTLGLFCYALLFQRVGTGALAASQIVSALESIFMLASIGLMIAATTLIGQAVGQGDAALAQSRAGLLLRIGLMTGLGFGALFLGTALFIPFFYPHVDPSVRFIAIWGIVISASFQAVRVRNIIFGGGILPSGGDTRTVIVGDMFGSFALGLPLAWVLAFTLHGGVWGLFAARAVEDSAKTLFFSWRARRLSWSALIAQQDSRVKAGN